MTKFIPKNTKTQVNTTLLGVQIVSEETPNCTVSFSVDGTDWTDHETVLTDVNNVIGSIPRYVYLKFSQDVNITVE